MAKISKVDTLSPSYLVGKGDIVIADPLAIGTVGLEAITNASSLGNIKEGSTKWTGDAPKFTEYKNEQGEVVCAVPVQGNYGAEFIVQSFSAAMQAKLLSGSAVATTFTAAGVMDVTSTVTGFGVKMPIYYGPIMFLNTDKNVVVVFPNAEIISQMVDDGGQTAIKCTVKALKVDTAKLQTVMVITGAAQY
jgi:hypothetical protein